MPELPEVEITRRQLEPALLGRTIGRVRTTGDSYFFLTSPSRLANRLRRRRVETLRRMGKYLLATLDSGERLLLHLGMTGDLFAAESFRADSHTHLRISFADGGSDVFFRDVRKFGKVQLLARGERSARLERLGIDALAARGDALFWATRRRRAAIKSVLLDQSVLAGVGNIYADEALYGASLRPSRHADRLTRAECRRLAAAVKRVLRRAIEAGPRDGGRPERAGEGERAWRVYGRAGKPCRRCRTPLARTVIAQRSAYYCPRCQR